MRAKITKEFVHCGLGYSPERRGMLVVENNAVNQLPIKIMSSKKTKQQGQSPADGDNQTEDDSKTLPTHNQPHILRSNVHYTSVTHDSSNDAKNPNQAMVSPS